MERSLVLLALVVHAGFGAPAPPAIGWPEIAVGGLLLSAIGLGPLACVFMGLRLGSPSAAPVSVAFAILFWVPLLRGAMRGWAPGDILRDAVPVGFLALSLLVGAMRNRVDARVLAAGLAVVGSGFALRYVAMATGLLGSAAPVLHLTYLPNDPAVLFAAVWLPLAAVDGGRRRALHGLVLLAAAGLCWFALILTLQRAALAAGAAVLGLELVRRSWRNPGLVPLLATMGGALWAAYGDMLSAAVTGLMLKTRLVGFNQHDAEIATTLRQFMASPAVILFGEGWGALVTTPAVPGTRVRFVHSFPLFLLLKAGLVGTAAAAAYLAARLEPLPALIGRSAATTAALPALGVALVLHTGFKTLDFGLLLALVALCAQERPSETQVRVGRAARPQVGSGY
jgi:hypothetical protein